MEDIQSPPRIDSLHPFSIQVIQHTQRGTETLEFQNVFPFETVFNLKQRITLAHRNDPDKKLWLPKQLFLASQEEETFRPLEFRWEFQSTMHDPLDPQILGNPSLQLFAGGERVPVAPTLFSGITLETALKHKIVHVWNIGAIADALGYKSQSVLTDEVFFGFVHLYFPMISTKEEFVQGFLELTDSDKEEFLFLESHRTNVSKRYQKLEEILKTKGIPSTPILTNLLDLHYDLPKKKRFAKGFLELRFYEMEPSIHMPFLRFFPSNIREMPIVKLMSTGGISAIENKKVLNKLLEDQPSSKLGAVILIKAPVRTPEAPLGTTWTIRIYEDGSAELTIGAPRKGQPLSGKVLKDAFEMLPKLLAQTPWLPTMELKLTQISAYYSFVSSAEGKPGREELTKRLDPFLPIFSLEKGLDATAQISLRFKAVSNYVKDSDPIMNYVTTLYSRDSSLSTDSKPRQEYEKELIKEFGIGRKEAEKYVDTWIANHTEQVVVGKNKVVFERNIGSAVSLYNDHPNYSFLLTNVESQIDLYRILTLLTVLTSYSSETLRVADTQMEEEKAKEVIQEEEDRIVEEKELEDKEDKEDKEAIEDKEEGEWSFEMAAQFPDEEEEDKEEQKEQKAANKVEVQRLNVVNKEIRKETIPSLGDEWYLDSLKKRDSGLFSYTDSPKPYSRVCQASAGKQPNVMDFATYARARLIYKTDVFWIESPLSGSHLFLLQFVSKTASERNKMKAPQSLGTSSLVEAEKMALRMGFGFKDGISITDLKTKQGAFVITENKQDKEEIASLQSEQQKKPLWIVVRAGSEQDTPNYYFCAELWCIKDNLPIIPKEFLSDQSRRKDSAGNFLKKEKESCPFCGGTVIENLKVPQPGETIVERKSPKSSKIQKFAGFAKATHPKGFALPCCFGDQDNQDLPEDTVPPPKKKPIDEEESDTESIQPVLIQEDKEREFRNRPFSEKKLGTSSKNDWYIPNQNILGRIVDRWSFVEKGSVSVPSSSVNRLLGQNPEQFLTKKGGILQGSINSQLKVPAHAFVQYGIGNSLRKPGANLISFLAYAQYVTEFLQNPNDNLSIEKNEDVIQEMLEDNELHMFRAFQQANYGTLVHEFGVVDTAVEEGVFQAWYSRVAMVSGGQRAYYLHLYKAWQNFKQYVHDVEEPKSLHVWESLFAQPGLLTKTGFLLVKILVPKTSTDDATIECPTFGISLKDRVRKPPLLFLLQDTVTGVYDPLVFYEGIFNEKKEPVKYLLGAIQESMPIFGKLSASIREPLQSFLTQYFSAYEGCARSDPPVHPWMPVRDSARIPKLADFYEDIHNLAPKTNLYLRISGLLRDRTNRLVGIIVYHKSPKENQQQPFFLPCVDDGTILQDVPSLYGGERRSEEDALPRPPLKEILDLLVGKHGAAVSDHKLASQSHFPGLKPVRLLLRVSKQEEQKYIVGIDLACGATIPCEPMVIERLQDIHKRGADLPFLVKEDMPWETDVTLLRPSKDKAVFGQTDEEVLEESYQHLRISLSNWLQENEYGQNVLKQIELLRQARKRLPLFELQKRLDLLLTPIIYSFLTEKGEKRSFLLRRDCLQIQKETDCVGGCSWSDGRCLIHTTQTERTVDPVRVLTARIVDELLRTFGLAEEILRQQVSHLKPFAKDQISHEGDTLMFSAFGRGDDALYEKLGYSRRRPGKYTQARTYPEEVSRADLDVGYTGYIPDDWKFTLPKFGADVRDVRSSVITALVEISGKSLNEIESTCGEFRGTEENWKAFAKMVNTNIVFTELHMYSLTPSFVIETEGSPTYLLLSSDSIPMVVRNTRKYIVTQKDLPKAIRIWLRVEEEAEKAEKAEKAGKAGKKDTEKKDTEKEEEEEKDNLDKGNGNTKDAEKAEKAEEAKLVFVLEDCDTVPKLNNLLESLYSDVLGNEQKHTFRTGKTLKVFKQEDLYQMYSSANEYDCLIHSFLTSLVPNFRRLDQIRKNAFAHYFRTSIFPDIVSQSRMPMEKQANALRRIRSTVFLLDEDIQSLCAKYAVNMLIFEDEKFEIILQFQKEEEETQKKKKPKQAQEKMPRCVTLEENAEDQEEVHMIYNNGDHFEAVRNKHGYTIAKDRAKQILATYPCQFHAEQSIQCMFQEGDKVIYEGRPHFVVWRISNEKGECVRYGLTHSEEILRQFQELSTKQQGSKKILEEYGPIVAQADKVAPFSE